MQLRLRLMWQLRLRLDLLSQLVDVPLFGAVCLLAVSLLPSLTPLRRAHSSARCCGLDLVHLVIFLHSSSSLV